jgi:Fic family protein
LLNESDGYSKADLPETHSILIYLTDEESGRYRIHGEGIFDGNQVILVAPPEERVPILMKDLFEWLKSDIKTPMLVLYISL